MTGFQFFEGNATESATSPRITVRRGGVLVLTGAAVEMLGQDVSHVQLGFNPETRAVGLRGSAEGNKGCYRLRPQGNGVSCLVDGKRLFAHHGLQAEKAESYEAQDFGEGVVGFVFAEVAPAQPKARSAKK